MAKTIVLRIPSEDIDICPGKNNTKISIKNNSEILLELDGDTMLKSSGKLFFLSEEEMGFISKSNIFIESIDSDLHLNSRLCSLIKDDPKSIAERATMELDHGKQLLAAQEQEEFTLLLKDRVTYLEHQMKKLIGEQNARNSTEE